jgi:hypothetical protein
MSRPTRLTRTGRAAVALAFLVASAAPAAAQAAPVDLATAAPFVVLGGSAVTNTGPSVLNGALGVSPGTSITGFGSPAVVNGPTHNNNSVAAQAQADLTAAYLVAAGQPVTSDMSGLDLGNRTLTPGAYRYSSSAQLTGPLTLDAQGNANAQFVFMIGSTLTTASASSVLLINGASPCNVFWQVGSSATLGTTTAFQGNVMALSDISLNNGATVIGRMLARNGAVTLINNVLSASACGASTTPGGSTPGDGDGSGPGGTVRNGTARFVRTPRTGGGRPVCTDGFRARVRGRAIDNVVFSLDGKRLGKRTKSPFQIYVRATPGSHKVRARVRFTDDTAARTLMLRYRPCASASANPRRGPSRFTG